LTVVRVAGLYDVHGNLPALEAVLADVDALGADMIVSGGDIATGPMAAECIDRLRARGDRVAWVRGNADRDAVPDHVRERSAAALAERVGDERRAFAAGAPLTTELDVDGLGRVLFCHGSPRSDEEILTKLTTDDRAASILDDVAGDLVVCGHTHVQFDRRLAGRRVVNAGSVGMPYEGRRGAFWALLGPEVELRQTNYDIDAAVEAMRATGYPADDQIGWLLDPPDPDEVSEYFESQAGS
jgi:putative phosphoesterase